MNQVNNIVISRRDFKDENLVYDKVAQQIRILLEAGYVIVAEDVEEKGGTIVIQYAPADEDANMPKPFWLMPNEMMAAADVHINNDVAKATATIEAAKKANAAGDIFGNIIKGHKPGGDA